MSRSKRRRHQSATPTAASASAQAPLLTPPAGTSYEKTSTASEVFSRSQWIWFRSVLALAALWWLALLIAAVTTSNPPTLSAFMVAQSDCVVRFRQSEDSVHAFTVEEAWPNPRVKDQTGIPSFGRISFPLPSGITLQPRTSYLIPLRKTGSGFEPPSQKFDEAGNRSVVPVTPTTLAQLKAILEGLGAEPQPDPQSN